MKNDKNSHQITPSGTPAHPEQTVPGNNPTPKARKYCVHLYWTQTNEAFRTITASSLAEAEEMADEIESEELTDDELNPIGGDLIIDSVTLIRKGQSHE